MSENKPHTGKARKPPRRRRCHYCERLATDGRLMPFTDGKNRFVCASCIEEDEINAAQERDEAYE